MINENKSFLNRNKGIIVAAITGLALGTALFLNLNAITQLFQQNAGPLVQLITPAITGIQQFINQIPSEWRSILLITVPTGIGGLIITWWKNRQMNKMAQASLNKIQELNANNFTAQQNQNALQLKYDEAKAQLDQYTSQNLGNTVQSLQSQLSDQKTMYEDRLLRMQNDFTVMERTLQDTINKLKQTPQIVVK